MKIEEILPRSKYRRYPLIIRIISMVLIAAFFAQDIAWACPDSLIDKPAQNNKLAPESLFKQKDKRVVVEGTFIEHLIERHPSIGSRISLYAIDKVMELKDINGWLVSNNITYRTYKNKADEIYEIRIVIPDWGTLRYFDPALLSETASTVESAVKPFEEINKHLLKEHIPAKISSLSRTKPAPLPAVDKENMKDADDAANFIERLAVRYGYREYGDDFLRQIFALFLACLSRDFDGSDDFVKMCRSELDTTPPFDVRLRMNDVLMTKCFTKIRKKDSADDISIGLYGVLIHYVVPDQEPYLKHAYKELMRERPKGMLSLGSVGTSYYTRGDSVAQIYRKGLLYGKRDNPFFKLFIYQYESLAQKSREDVDNRIDSKNALKILKAVDLWREEAYRRNDREMSARIDDFINQTTVLEIDLKSKLFFSDPDNNVVRLVHIEGRKRALEFPEGYLTNLDTSDDLQVRELATWLDFGQRLIDRSHKMIDAGLNAESIQGARSDLTLSFLDDEFAHFVEAGYLRNKLAKFMEEDTVYKYKSMVVKLAQLENDAARLLILGRSGKDTAFFAKARNVYKRLLYHYEALGMQSRSDRAYDNMLVATENVRLYDRGGFLPCQCHIDNIFTALRFGRWDDFLSGLRTVLTGKGFPTRDIERSEIETLKDMLTPSNEKHTGFEDDIRHALFAHLEAVGRDKIGWVIEAAEGLLEDYFGDKEKFGRQAGAGYLEKAFGGLELNEIGYFDKIAPVEKPFISGADETALYDDVEALNKAADMMKALKGQRLRPVRRPSLSGANFKEIIGSVRTRFETIKSSLLSKERAAVLRALEGLERQRLIEFDSVVLRDEKGSGRPVAWLLGLNTIKRSPGAGPDLFSEELQEKMAGAFPDSILLSRGVLDEVEKRYNLLCEYIFTIAVSPYAGRAASRSIRKKIFPSNYPPIKTGSYANWHVSELESLLGDLTVRRGAGAATGVPIEPERRLPRFGKVDSIRRVLREAGHRYFIVQNDKVRYFRYRWNIFESLDDHIMRNLKERKWIDMTLADIKSVQAAFEEVKCIKENIPEGRKAGIGKKLKQMLKVIGASRIRLPDKQRAAGRIMSAMGDYNEGSYESLRSSWANLREAARYLEKRRYVVERTALKLRAVLRLGRSWAKETNSYMAKVAESQDPNDLYRLAERDEIKAPENEPEFTGLEPLVREAIRNIKSPSADLAAAKNSLERAANELKAANILHDFMADYRDAYYETQYSAGDNGSAEKVFQEIWLKYLAKEGRIRGAPAYWYARFYQASFIHQTVSDPQKHSVRIINPLFSAATILIRIIDLQNFDSILSTRSLLVKEAFPNTRTLLEGFKDKRKKGGDKKTTLADLSEEERRDIIRNIVLDMGLSKFDLQTLNRCAAVKGLWDSGSVTPARPSEVDQPESQQSAGVKNESVPQVDTPLISAASNVQKHSQELAHTIASGISLSLGFGVILGLMGFLFSGWMLAAFFGPEQLVAGFGREFLEIYFIGMCCALFIFPSIEVLRCLKLDKPAMAIIGLHAAVNIGLDYLLILGSCGFPRWGVAGYATATVAADSLAGFYMLYLIFKGCRISLEKNHAEDGNGGDSPRAMLKKSVLKKSWPTAISEILFIVNGLAEAAFICQFSGSALAGVGLALTIIGLFSIPRGIIFTGINSFISKAVGSVENELQGQESEKFITIRFKPRHFIETEQMKKILKKGMPSLFEQVLGAGKALCVNMIVARLGTAALTAYNVINRIYGAGTFFITVLASSARRMTGEYKGYHDNGQAVRSTWYCAVLGAGLTLSLSAVIFYFPGLCAGLISPDREIIAIAIANLPLVAFALIALSIGQVLSSSLIGAGDTRSPALIGIGSGTFLFTILAYILSTVYGLSLEGIYWANAVSTVVQLVWVKYLFDKARWMLNHSPFVLSEKRADAGYFKNFGTERISVEIKDGNIRLVGLDEEPITAKNLVIFEKRLKRMFRYLSREMPRAPPRLMRIPVSITPYTGKRAVAGVGNCRLMGEYDGGMREVELFPIVIQRIDKLARLLRVSKKNANKFITVLLLDTFRRAIETEEEKRYTQAECDSWLMEWLYRPENRPFLKAVKAVTNSKNKNEIYILNNTGDGPIDAAPDIPAKQTKIMGPTPPTEEDLRDIKNAGFGTPYFATGKPRGKGPESKVPFMKNTEGTNKILRLRQIKSDIELHYLVLADRLVGGEDYTALWQSLPKETTARIAGYAGSDYDEKFRDVKIEVLVNLVNRLADARLTEIADNAEKAGNLVEVALIAEAYDKVDCDTPDRIMDIADRASAKRKATMDFVNTYGLVPPPGIYCASKTEADELLKAMLLRKKYGTKDLYPELIKIIEQYIEGPIENSRGHRGTHFDAYVQASNALNRLREIRVEWLVSDLLDIEKMSDNNGVLMGRFWNTNIGRDLISRASIKPRYVNSIDIAEDDMTDTPVSKYAYKKMLDAKKAKSRVGDSPETAASGSSKGAARKKAKGPTPPTEEDLRDIKNAGFDTPYFVTGKPKDDPISRNTTAKAGHKHKVLVLCDHNVERSPIAVALMLSDMPEDLSGRFDISSAAIYESGEDTYIRQYVDKDPTLRLHIKRVVTEQDIKGADIIFVMTEYQKEYILKKYPGVEGRLYLLLGREDLNTGIGDYPNLEDLYLPSARPYRAVKEKIRDGLDGIYRKMRRALVKTHSLTAPASENLQLMDVILKKVFNVKNRLKNNKVPELLSADGRPIRIAGGLLHGLTNFIEYFRQLKSNKTVAEMNLTVCIQDFEYSLAVLEIVKERIENNIDIERSDFAFFYGAPLVQYSFLRGLVASIKSSVGRNELNPNQAGAIENLIKEIREITAELRSLRDEIKERSVVAPAIGVDKAKDESVSGAIEKIGRLFKDISLPDDSKVLLSENIFIADDDRKELDDIKLALKPLLDNGAISILSPEDIKRRATNNKISKEKLTVVLSAEEFNDASIWKDSDKETRIKSSILILGDKLTGSNYLYLQGVIGLARAIMANNRQAVGYYYRILSGVAVDENVLKLLDDGRENNVAFAVKAILRFKEIVRQDPEELRMNIIRMETLLIAA